MPTPISIPKKTHFILDGALDVTGRESFVSPDGEKAFFGVQFTSWQRDNQVWGFREGKFYPVRVNTDFNRTIATKLRISGATLEADGSDVLARHAAGTLTALCELAYQTTSTVQVLEFRLYNCTDGSVATQFAPRPTTSQTIAANLSVIDGSYILWVRCYDTYFTFPEGNGPKPQADIVAEQRNAGEWSALKVRVGDGSFAVAPGIDPSPGSPMLAKDAAAPTAIINAGNLNEYKVLFDPFARSLSAFCVTDTEVRKVNGTFDVPAKAVIGSGLRTSPNGPQCALWHVHDDLTARLLATTEVFSNGLCECGKADHHASDVAQHPDGTLYVLNECSLHRYAPDAPLIGDKLPGSPALNGGHPGGQSLRFDNGQIIFSTELLEEKPKDLGFFFYNRLVKRLNQSDGIGCGTTWHGPGCIEMFRGALWGIRGDGQDLEYETTRIYFDQIVNGAWKGGGVAYKPLQDFWRQLKRRGSLLFMFGFNSGGNLVHDKPMQVANELTGTTDSPTCIINDGRTLRRADFPYFVRRATRCTVDGSETLMVVCSSTTTALANRNDGRSLRVVELSSAGTDSTGATKICSFWNDPPGEFRMTQNIFTKAGGDVAKLPPFMSWQEKAGSNGGGAWQAASVQPDEPYLQLDTSGGALIRYKLFGDPPYNLDVWGLLCFAILSDGSVGGIDGGDGFEPSPSATNAQEALDSMPPGTMARWEIRDVSFPSNPLSSFQITDTSVGRTLRQEREVYPSIWTRIDSSAAPYELTSYTKLARYSKGQATDMEAKQSLHVMFLVTPDSMPCQLPVLGRGS